VSVITSFCFRMLYRAWDLPGPMRWWRREVIMYFSYILRKSDLMLFTCFSVHEPWFCHYFYFIWLLSTVLFSIEKTDCLHIMLVWVLIILSLYIYNLPMMLV
jgi:hypothetical protein